MPSPAEANFNTTPVLLFPVDFNGNRLPDDGVPRIVTVDNERIVISPLGTLVAQWKAEYIISTARYKHVYTDKMLEDLGHQQGTAVFRSMSGTTTNKPKFAFTTPEAGAVRLSAVAIDEEAFKEMSQRNDGFAAVAAAFAEPIRATMRSHPNLDLESVFIQFVNLLEETVDA